jgi:hypothetical protein
MTQIPLFSHLTTLRRNYAGTSPELRRNFAGITPAPFRRVTHQVIKQPFLFEKPDFAAAGTRCALCPLQYAGKQAGKNRRRENE